MHYICILTIFSCIIDVCYICWMVVLLGLDCAEPMMLFMLHITCSCIFMHTYLHFFIFIFWFVLVLFCVFLSLPLSFFRLVALWHLNKNPLRPRTLFVLGHLPLILHLPMSGSVMRRPSWTSRRTFHDAAFIQNAKSFYPIFLILTFPLSSIVGVRGHYVASRSLVPLWSFKSFTPICTDSILQYLILSLTFEVHAL